MEPYTTRYIPYAYEPLPDGDFIRLMHLQPALNEDEPLRFTFVIGHIENLIARYEAISYTWGAPRQAYPLHFDETCIMITRNLNGALRRLRLPTTSRTLWADAVCINQKDDREKSRQIPLMTRLYRSASRVLAWLDGGDEEEYGMQVLDSLSRRTLLTLDDFGLDVQLSERNAIGAFLSSSWFTRLWIVQEVVMNSDMVLICQSSELSWLRFTIALSMCANRHQPDQILVDPSKLGVLLQVIELWKYHNMTNERLPIKRVSRTYGIIDLVNIFLQYGCTDPRDRIFALYNVATDVRVTALRSQTQLTLSSYLPKVVIYMDVDYSLDIKQVYHTFAVACISGGRELDIFEAVLRRTASQSSENWYSWVPDWRKPVSPSWVYPGRPSPQSPGWDFSQAAFKVHGAQSDVLSITWRRFDMQYPINIIDTTLPFPRAKSVPGMVSSLREQLAACSSSLVDCLLEKLGLGESRIHRLDDGSLVCRWEYTQPADMPGWMQAQSQRPRLFIANSPSPTELLVGMTCADVLEGDEVVSYAETSNKIDPVTENCLLIRKRSVYTDNDGRRGMLHRLIGTAQVARFRASVSGDAGFSSQDVTLYLG